MAKPQRKIEARLSERLKRFESMVKSKGNTAFKKPGSRKKKNSGKG